MVWVLKMVSNVKSIDIYWIYNSLVRNYMKLTRMFLMFFFSFLILFSWLANSLGDWGHSILYAYMIPIANLVTWKKKKQNETKLEELETFFLFHSWSNWSFHLNSQPLLYMSSPTKSCARIIKLEVIFRWSFCVGLRGNKNVATHKKWIPIIGFTINWPTST